MSAKASTLWSEGDVLPPAENIKIRRHALALYCGASGDHNPIHTDIDFARKLGFDDVIPHGMLLMAWLGRFLTDQFPTGKIESFSARFLAPAGVGREFAADGRITKRSEDGDAVRLSIELRGFAGTTPVVASEAVVSLARRV